MEIRNRTELVVNFNIACAYF